MWQWLNLNVAQQPPINIYFELSMPLYLFFDFASGNIKILVKIKLSEPESLRTSDYSAGLKVYF